MKKAIVPDRYDLAYMEATRRAKDGLGVCRLCDKHRPFDEFISVLYGGGVVFVLCIECVAVKGSEILIKRGAKGIEVLHRGASTLSIASSPLSGAQLLKGKP
jgi:hypothetical protein